MDMPITNEVKNKLTRKDKSIEDGWLTYLLFVHPDKKDEFLSIEEQQKQLRDAFFFGAVHLYDIIMSLTSEGDVLTKEEEQKVENIANELQNFAKMRALDKKDG
jgi:hypothetical protein